MFENIREIIERHIGEPRRDNDGWLEYNCPYCADEKGVESDGKYNLAVNYGEDLKTKPFFHCWRCNTSGKLIKLLKDFGDAESVAQYNKELKDVKSALLYQLDGNNFGEEFSVDSTVELPNDYRKITPDDKYAREATEYLFKRGLNWYFINRYDIGYVPYWSNDKEMRNRVIIPSYDKYDELNYYVARDYTGKRTYRKYNNPDVKKTLFVFNENKVNWYEDVTIVEGAFDHMVVPNSIPLLGKTLKSDYATYSAIVENAKTNVNVFLDDDAIDDARKIYKTLESTRLKGRVRIIECPNGFDASLIYEKYGTVGIKAVMKKARRLDDCEIDGLE